MNNENVSKEDIRKYIQVDSDVIENLLAVLTMNGMIKVYNNNEEFSIDEKGIDFIRRIETIIDPICVPASINELKIISKV
jgi:predicted transcriptional regulator